MASVGSVSASGPKILCLKCRLLDINLLFREMLYGYGYTEYVYYITTVTVVKKRYVPPFLQGQTKRNIMIIFNSWIHIVCSQQMSEVWNPRASTNAEFAPLRCLARLSMHPFLDAACLRVFSACTLVLQHYITV